MRDKPPITLWKAMFSEIIRSFLTAFFFFFIVFLINQVLLFAEDILSKGADLLSVLKLLFYSLPTILAITIPFSVLAATLMTSSRQNSDNEFLAASTLGTRPVWLYLPFVIIGLLIAIGSFMLNDWSIPRASQGFKRVYAELIRNSARIELAPYSVTKYGDKLLVTGAADTESVREIAIIDQQDGPDPNVITAKDVTLTFAEDSLSAILRMKNIIEERKIAKDKEGDFAVTTAASAEISLQIQEQIPNYSSTAPSEMPLASLARQIEEKQQRLERRLNENRAQRALAQDRLRMSYNEMANADYTPSPQHSSKIRAALNSIDSLSSQKIYDASLQVYRLEYQKKFVIPSACFFFAFLAFPLGIGSKRAGRMAGFGLALLLSVIYWAFLFAGQTLGYRQGFNPVISMWMPNIIMVLATLVLWIARKISGGHFL